MSDPSANDPRPAEEEQPAELLLQRLAAKAASSRYKERSHLARGGMGTILEVWDEDLRRVLAMKVVLGDGQPGPEQGQTPPERKRLLRFLEEAQVTAQLDHPGIVPVHELGLDDQGRLFFTMKLVKGRDLKAIFELVFRGQEGWNETRALSVILKACEALAYAHKKGVIHRDLKPANVMVGNFGEVYVMDWGLARVLARKDPHDIRLQPEGTALLSIHSARRSQREEDPDSPLFTMDGDVVGTPAYMSPEQARGAVEELSPRSDVYAMGALLYHLLARQAPYLPPGMRLSSRSVLARVVEGPPRPLLSIRPDVPSELVAIVERAMARAPEQRYHDTLELADDLRAYLEHRVVKAYQTGALAELRKWVQRNRALAGALAAAMLALLVGLSTSLVFWHRALESEALAMASARASAESAAQAREQATRARESEERARASEQRAVEEERLARQRAQEVLQLAALQRLEDLVAAADRLWPAHPENVGAYEEWLWAAHELLLELPQHRQKRDELASLLRAGELRSPEQPEADRWWHSQLEKLVQGLEALGDERTGLVAAGISPAHGWGMEKRIEFAATIRQRSLEDVPARECWRRALESIADPAECPQYGGLVLEPQLGLLPIGRDPASGLWEFAHLQTGTPAERDPDGRLALREENGLVFVLLPGGTYTMGAQADDPTGPNHDPRADFDEGPPHTVLLSPFFLSKYEMTQSQWERFTGSNPSVFGPERYDVDWDRSQRGWSGLHPVEQVSWSDCMETMERLGLELPSEAQWEYACRAGSTSVYWTGDEPQSLQGAANVCDAFGKAHGNDVWTIWEASIDDGHTVHAEVGSFAANAFGLHDVHGNVWECCRDGHKTDFYAFRDSAKKDPLCLPETATDRVARGGSFDHPAAYARSALRFIIAPEGANGMVGLRPARSITTDAAAQDAR